MALRIEHILISDRVAAKLYNKHRLTDVEVREVLTARGYPQVVWRFKGQALYQVFGRTESGRYVFCLIRDLGGGVVRVITAWEMTDAQRRYYQSRVGER